MRHIAKRENNIKTQTKRRKQTVYCSSARGEANKEYKRILKTYP